MADDPDADVDTVLILEPPLPPPWDDHVHRQLYDGVHAGLAGAGQPLPTGGVRVLITKLRIDPPLDPATSPTEIHSVADTIRALAAATVGALWTGLSQPIVSDQ